MATVINPLYHQVSDTESGKINVELPDTLSEMRNSSNTVSSPNELSTTEVRNEISIPVKWGKKITILLIGIILFMGLIIVFLTPSTSENSKNNNNNDINKMNDDTITCDNHSGNTKSSLNISSLVPIWNKEYFPNIDTEDQFNYGTGGIKTYYSSSNKEYVYAFIPSSVMNRRIPYLMVQQITHGRGIKEESLDPGRIITQKLISFEFDHDNVYIIERQMKHRNGDIETYINSCNDILTLQSTGQCVGGGKNVHQSFSNNRVDTLPIEGYEGPSSSSDSGLEGSYIIDNRNGVEGVYVKLSHRPNAAASISTISSTGYRLISEGVKANVFTFSIEAAMLLENTNTGSQGEIGSYKAEIHVRESYLAVEGGWRDILSDSSSTSSSTSGTNIPDGVKRPASEPFRAHHPSSGFNSVTFANESSEFLSSRYTHLMTKYFITPESPSLSINIRRSTTAATTTTTMKTLNLRVKNGLSYCVDHGVPTSLREVVVEGVSYWDRAFMEAGFSSHTMVVDICEETHDLFDLSPRIISNNNGIVTIAVGGVVHWFWRDIRGYSIGQRIVDPRSGRILAGHARLGGLRIRKDYELMHALTAGQNKDEMIPEYPGSIVTENKFGRIERIALSRLRTLAAHEVGHTLGLAHNFAGSVISFGTWFHPENPFSGSVMDYPKVWVTLDSTQNEVQVYDSFIHGIGSYDIVSFQCAYSDLELFYSNISSQDIASLSGYELLIFQTKALQSLISTKIDEGLYIFLSDQDADDGLDYRSSRWDDVVSSPTQQKYIVQTSTNKSISAEVVFKALNTLNIRTKALEGIITELTNQNTASSYLSASTSLQLPLSSSYLQNSLTDIWLWHRYEIKALCKLIGGKHKSLSLAPQYTGQSSLDSSLGIPSTSAAASATSNFAVDVDPDLQWASLLLAVTALLPNHTELPSSISDHMEVGSFDGYDYKHKGVYNDGDSMMGRAGRYLDSTAATEIVAGYIIDTLMLPSRMERLARVVKQEYPTILDVLNLFASFFTGEVSTSLNSGLEKGQLILNVLDSATSVSWNWNSLLGFTDINQMIVKYSGTSSGMALRMIQAVILDRLITAFNSGCVSDTAERGCSVLVLAAIKRTLKTISVSISPFSDVESLSNIDSDVAELWVSHFSHLKDSIDTSTSPILSPQLVTPPGPPI